MERQRHRIVVIALVLAFTFPTGANAATLDNASILNVLSGVLTTFSQMLATMSGRQSNTAAVSIPVSQSVAAGGNYAAPFAAAQRVDNLSNVTVNGVTGLTASDIPSLSYLPLSGGTVTGNLTVSGAFSGGTLSLSVASTSNLVATNATSSNLFAVLGRFTTAIIDTLNATVATITNLIATTITSTNATFTNATTTNATSTNSFVTNFSATNATTSNLSVSGSANVSGVLTPSSIAVAFDNFDYSTLLQPLSRSPLTYSTSSVSFNGTLNLGGQKNIWQNTENLGSSSYSKQSGTASTSTMVWNGITLTNFTTSNFYGSIYSNLNGIGFNNLVPGQRYLFSYYITDVDAGDHLIWMRSIADTGSYGHGPHLIDNTVRRVWQEVQAITSTTVDALPDPTVALGSGSGSNPFWLTSAYNDSSGTIASLNVYLGGFQIEAVNDASPIGIALIGDSTMAGGAGLKDLIASREVSTYAAALMNVPWFNRAVGGNTCGDMVSRWPTDMAPLATNSKYAVIQCGINDVGQGIAIGTVETNISTLVNDATSAGMIPVVMTITPRGATGSTESERQSLNLWIKQTFPRVLDIASIIQDPNATSSLSKNPAYIGDGVHYSQAAKRRIANYIAQSTVGNNSGYPEIFEFPAPSQYQPIKNTSYTGQGALNVNGSATSTFSNGINLSAGCFSIGGTCISGGGAASQWTTGSNSIYYNSGSVGIGTTSPFALFSIATPNGATGSQTVLFTVSSSTPSATTSLFTITNAGNIGVGTASPGAKLDIGAILQSAVSTLQQTLSNNALAINYLHGSGGYVPGLTWYSTDNNATKPKGGMWLQDSSAGTSLQFGTTNSFATGITNTALTINPAGNIGIGTTTPQYPLVANSGNVLFNDSTGSFYPSLVTKLTIVGNSPLITLAHNTNFGNGSAGIEFTPGGSGQNSGSYKVYGSPTAGPFGAGLVFELGNLGAIGGGTFVAKFDGNGNFGIGTTTPYARLTVWGPDSNATTSAFLVANSASTTLFSVYDNGNATYAGSIFQSSDQRLKTAITPLDSSTSLSLVTSLNPVSYTRLDQPDGGTNLGFVAQEVQKLFPALVSTTSPTALTPDGTLTLNYVGLIAPIVKSIQQLGQQIANFADSFTTKELTFTRATGDEITVRKATVQELCVGSTCLTESQVQALLNQVGQQPSAPSAPGPSDSSDASSMPEETDTPSIVPDEPMATSTTS